MNAQASATPFSIDEPAGNSSARTLILAHGAGAAMDSPFMQTVATGLARHGLRVIRFEFPYMRKRRQDGKRRPPDGARLLRDTWESVISEIGANDLIIGGKSMGGRVASMVADDAEVAGLVCLGYPFHPPGSPEKTRTVHLESLGTPTLILQGTRDPFGKPDEVDNYPLSDNIRIHWIEDGDHSFKPRAKSGGTFEQNLDEALEAIATFAADVTGLA